MASEDVIRSLKKLGLTEYEAKAYIALVRAGPGTASKVSELSGVPRASVYDVLRGLERRGLIESRPGRPSMHRAVSSKILVEKLGREYEKAREEALESLEKLSKIAPKVEEEGVWMVRGGENIRDRIVDMLARAKEKALIVLPPEDLPSYTHVLEDLRDRGVKASLVLHLLRVERATRELLQRMTTHPETDVGPKVYETVGEREEALPLDGVSIILADDKEVLLGVRRKRAPAEEVAIWSNSETFVTVFTWMFERLLLPRRREEK